MKSVVVIGAGPAGLVAAKTLLHSFRVTVLDRNTRVGGMWAVERGERGAILSPDMPTNLSRFTVAFSDLAWESVGLDEAVPMFPRAWQVGRYLQAYARKFIPPGVIQLGARVTSAQRIQDGDRDMWKVEWRGSPEAGVPTTAFFDFLVVASGFFHTPKPHGLVLPVEVSVPDMVQHSATFRDLDGLVPEECSIENASIVVIGGGLSGCEAAAAAALQVANCQHSPTPSGRDYGSCKVYHIISRPFYVVPRYLPSPPPHMSCPDADSNDYPRDPFFVPLDLRMYDLSPVTTAPVRHNYGCESADLPSLKHRYFQTLLGGDQRDLGCAALSVTEADQHRPAYVAISDSYAEFVRSANIVPIRGEAKELRLQTGLDGRKMCSVWVGPEEDKSIDNVIGIINATGYSPSDAFSWMDRSVLAAMEYQETCCRLPLLLNRRCTCRDDIPSLGFVGFYERPFWGVMELQSQLIARKWTADDQLAQSHSADTFRAEITEMRELRDAMTQKRGNIPKLWTADYTGVMEDLARELGIQRDDDGFTDSGNPSVPARYAPPGSDLAQVSTSIADLHRTMDQFTNGTRFVAAAGFRALQGKWTITRTLDSKLPGFPSGTFYGTAHFHPRYPTDAAFDAEYLYIEDLRITVGGGQSLQATRRYVYRYKAAVDKISVWFVKQDGKSVDYLFFDMGFLMPTNERENRRLGWMAQGSHLCDEDMYASRCEFRFRGVYLDGFRVRYDVRGPKKDYVSENWYER